MSELSFKLTKIEKNTEFSHNEIYLPKLMRVSWFNWFIEIATGFNHSLQSTTEAFSTVSLLKMVNAAAILAFGLLLMLHGVLLVFSSTAPDI